MHTIRKNEKQKGFLTPLLISVVIILLIGGGVSFYINSKINNNKNDAIVGNDKDIHGCIGSAGYSWCEVKNKCLRVWEEKCEITLPVVATTSPDLQIWLETLINEQKSRPVANPPSSISQCTYKEKTIYYLKPRCCDIQGIVYDYNGKIICHPDGGFSGKGDGLCLDFFETRKNCSTTWEDNRK